MPFKRHIFKNNSQKKKKINRRLAKYTENALGWCNAFGNELVKNNPSCIFAAVWSILPFDSETTDTDPHM